LRHNRRSGLVGEFQNLRDLRDRIRPQHHGRAPLEHIAHLDDIWRLHLRIGDGVFVTDDRGEARQQRRIDRFVQLGRFRLIEHDAIPTTA
jgi:hypothetical protein